jgi:hypothetical protein
MGMNEIQRFNSLLRLNFSPSIIEDHISLEGVKEVSRKAYGKLGRAMHGINSHPTKSALLEETHASLYEFITKLKDDPLPGQYSKAAQENFDARHHAWCENRTTAFNNPPRSPDEEPVHPKFTLTYGHAQMWINMTLKYLTILGHPTAVFNYRYFHVPVDYTDAVHPTDALGVSRPLRGVPWSRLDRDQYWNYQQRLRSAGITLLDI